MRLFLAVVTVCLTSVLASASSERPVSVQARAKGAQRVVVATIVDVRPRFHVNEFGDRLIVSDTLVQIDETLKGPGASMLEVTLEGGTIGDLTLNVSDMPSLRVQERAVLFLEQTPSGVLVPHGRGLGVVKLDKSDRADGTDVTLAEIRSAVRAAVK